MAGAGNFSLAIKSDGTLWVTGTGSFFGSPVVTRDSWGQVLSDVADVAAGSSFSLAVKNDGALWVTGFNDYR